MVTVLLLLLPVAGALLLLPLKGEKAKQFALITALIQLLVTAYAWSGITDYSKVNFLFDASWIPSMGVHFKVGMDGLSFMLVLLTNLLVPFIIASTQSEKFKKASSFYALILLMQSAMLGVFTALDGFAFYIFWELALIPIFFILLIWGGENRVKVTTKFFIYTIAGSIFMLIGLITLYLNAPERSWDIANLYQANLDADTQCMVFWFIFLAFAIKIPIFPFHTWQPSTYTQAPAAGTMVLSGIMLKMGIYSLFRWLLPVAPQAVADYSQLIMILAIVGVIYASWIAMQQRDLKTLLAYSSMAHVGLIAAGAFSGQLIGIQGAMYQMFSHGIIVVGLFIGVDIIERRTNLRDITLLGGIRNTAPWFSAFFLIIVLGSIALPITSGFVGEIMLLLGIFLHNQWMAAVAGVSVILGAVYMLRMYQKAILGPENETNGSFKDLTTSEMLLIVPIVLLILGLGVYPKPILDLTESIATNFLIK